jgi:hypothetical protein
MQTIRKTVTKNVFNRVKGWEDVELVAIKGTSMGRDVVAAEVNRPREKAAANRYGPSAT